MPKCMKNVAKIIVGSAMARIGPESDESLDTANNVKYGKLAPCNEAYYSVTVEMGEGHALPKSTIKEPQSQKEHDCSIDEISSGTKELVKPQAIIDLSGNFIKWEPTACSQWCAKHRTENFNVLPQLELSLGRFSHAHSKGGKNEEQHKLVHSKASAFSRYDNNKIWQPVFPTMAGVTTAPKEAASASENHLFDQHFAFYNLWGHGASFAEGLENLTSSKLGHCGKSRGPFPLVGFGFVSIPGVRSEGGLCPPMFHVQPGLSPVWSSKSQHGQFSIAPNFSINATSNVQNPEEGFFSLQQIVNASAEEEQVNYNESETLKAKKVVSPTPGYYDVSNSATKNCSTAVSASICSTSEEDSILAPEIRTTNLSERIDDNHLQANNGEKGTVYCCTNQREAAFVKFRLKRKDRCSETKVQYQSRKRLAEQCPRVKGQFVRQAHSEMPNVGADICNCDREWFSVSKSSSN